MSEKASEAAQSATVEKSTRKSAKKDEIVPTACTDWSLNNDNDTKKMFWWNKTYSISIWNNNIRLQPPYSQLTDTDVWREFIRYQLGAVYTMCLVCSQPEGNDDLFVCCYCGGTVHKECSVEASKEQMAWKKANCGFEEHLRACFECEDVADKMPARPHRKEVDNARRAARRAQRLAAEYPRHLVQKLRDLEAEASKPHSDEAEGVLLDQIRDVVQEYFQPGLSASMIEKKNIATKGNGIGVVAKKPIPAFTVIGVYPGYEDPLSGEQAKCGRPSPKYSLVDLNCANYYNEVFTELQKTFTPFVNEPNVGEQSNCAWIQEPHRPEGRLSVMNVRDIKEGEELLIGYGPLYPRDYPHSYDAYAFHSVEGHSDPPCLALWHWTSTEEKDSSFVCYIGYDKEADSYAYWETEDEANEKKKAK